jgi:transposase-like protein
MKLCPKCNLVKPADAFHKDTRRVGGLDYRCKDCKRKYNCTLSQQRRDARRYLKDKLKVVARTKARDFYGPASKKACAVLNCYERAEELHHVDYEDALAVIPLCVRHHRLNHLV